MLIPFNHIVETHKPVITGILHVGAGECEEIEDYEKHISRNKILWINPGSDNVAFCKSMHPGIQIECANAGDSEMRDIVYKHDVPFNFLTIDLQGFETQILDGLGELLTLVDYVYFEISSVDTMLELDTYMKKYQLRNLETKWWDEGTWADVFYARSIR
jgi:hypothetical protein